MPRDVDPELPLCAIKDRGIINGTVASGTGETELRKSPPMIDRNLEREKDSGSRYCFIARYSLTDRRVLGSASEI